MPVAHIGLSWHKLSLPTAQCTGMIGLGDEHDCGSVIPEINLININSYYNILLISAAICHDRSKVQTVSYC
jgi:hypothetical protein